MAPDTQVPVLIVGGGIVGLSASLFLAHHGIHSILVERHSGTSIHPRARATNARTMELFRHIGLEERIREAGKSLSGAKGIYSGSSLREVIEALPRTEGNRELPFRGLSAQLGPAGGIWVTQDFLEPVLLSAAKARGIDVRFYTEASDITQDENGVSATLKDRETNKTSTVRAQYLIAADGANSPIRTQLKVPIMGRGTLGYALNILFRADLRELVRQREFSLCVINRPEIPLYGNFASINNDDRWTFHIFYDHAGGERAEDFPPEKCKELLHAALGINDVDIDIKSIMPWEPSVRVAKTFKHGRIFLAGDAAHQMPPWGGQGANSGVADAHNLAWKIAAVLKEHRPEKLLETYDAERIPVGLEAAEASAGGVNDRGMIPVERSLTVAKSWIRRMPLLGGFGYIYNSPAICTESTFPLGGVTWKPWTMPSLALSIDGRPGTRAPHIWVEKQGQRISTLDLFGKSLVVLAGEDGAQWKEAAKNVSSTTGVKVEAYCVGPRGDLVTPQGVFETAAGISWRGAILVRPDDFVVWRERRLPSDHQTKLEQAVKQALCL